LPLELKMAVKDMYIDPSTLSFSFKAHEIGRGTYLLSYFNSFDAIQLKFLYS